MKKIAELVVTFIIGITFGGCSNTNANRVNVKDASPVTAVAFTETPKATTTEATTTKTTTTKATTTKSTTTKATTTTRTTAESSRETTSNSKATTTTAVSVTTTAVPTTTTTVPVTSTAVPVTTTTAPAATTTAPVTTTTVDPSKVKKEVMLYVENIQQVPELPMGCEAVSGSIALKWYGFDVDKFSLLEYQPMDEAPENGVWGNPNEVFVGNPRTFKWGCYSPVIKKTIEAYFAANNINDYEVVSLDGYNFKDLYPEIDAGNPIILWVTTFMQDVEPGDTWLLKDGSSFTWTKHEHCVCLIGYNTSKDTVIISDPYDERGTIEYPRKKVEHVYKQLNNMALVIHRK